MKTLLFALVAMAVTNSTAHAQSELEVHGHSAWMIEKGQRVLVITGEPAEALFNDPAATVTADDDTSTVKSYGAFECRFHKGDIRQLMKIGILQLMLFNSSGWYLEDFRYLCIMRGLPKAPAHP
jgi:hypothetical protein